MEVVHGHQLIGLIIQQNRPVTLTEVKTLAEKYIGTEVSYYTCSEQGMNTEQMIQFLLNRRKLIEREGGYVIDTGEVCSNEEEPAHTH